MRLFLEHILGWESIFFSCISPISLHRMCFRKFLFCVPNPTSSLLKSFFLGLSQILPEIPFLINHLCNPLRQSGMLNGIRKYFCCQNNMTTIQHPHNIMVGDGLKNIEKIKGNVFWCCPQLSCVINLVGTLKTLLHPIPSTLKESHHPSFPYSKKLVNFVNNCIIRLYYGVNVFG